MPKRIQRKRTKGWRMPEGAVYVGRPTKWGNPFQITGPITREKCLRIYKAWITGGTFTEKSIAKIMGKGVECPDQPLAIFRLQATRGILRKQLNELRGKDLACWCPLEDEHGDRVPCHADVLLEIANS